MIERISNIPEIIPCRDVTYRELIFTENNEIHLWRIKPGEWIYPHIHPHTEDIWHIVQGVGEYYTTSKKNKTVEPGDIAVAFPGEVHGIFNSGSEEIIVFSVLAPLPVEIFVAPGFDYPE